VGGHGALTLALRHPSPLSPRWRPRVGCREASKPWGDSSGRTARWAEHDAAELVKQRRFPGVIRIDQGTADQYLDEQLRPELFSAAGAEAGQPLDLRMRAGYDHGYWFIQTFVEEHLRHHAAALL
jgi:S-formylglutathione hydrolase